MDIKQIRLQNLLSLAKRHGQDVDFCRQIDMNPSYLPQLKAKTKTIGDKIARKVEERLGLEHGYMDRSHEPEEAQDTPPDNDVMATAYAIQTLPDELRERFTSLVFQMAATCNTAKKSRDVQPFDITIQKEIEDDGSKIPTAKEM